VLLEALRGMRASWAPDERARSLEVPLEDLRALGFDGPADFAPTAREIVVREILDPLATIGIEISAADRAALLAG